MNIRLEAKNLYPDDRRKVEAIASQSGQDPELLLRDLVHEALELRETNGEPPRRPVPPELSLSGLAGVGKELWAGEDAQEYVSRLRSEWE